jgi:transcriptional regulator with XRE-family HTH domain
MNEPTTLEKARSLIRESGLTYEQVGRRMGYPPESARQAVWKFLGSTNPSVSMVKRLAKALGVDVKELL